MTLLETATLPVKGARVAFMTPLQCRAGRAVLDWTQPQLASAAKVSLSTVIDYERSRRVVSRKAERAIRLALENAGVVFLNGDGVKMIP
jgi:transcriptional regulator with XRE-family HTH domain